MDQREAKRLEVDTEWNGKANVCVHCGRVPETFYIVTGHDHTDDSIRWCLCRDTSEIERLRTKNNQLEAALAVAKDALENYKIVCQDYDFPPHYKDAVKAIAKINEVMGVE